MVVKKLNQIESVQKFMQVGVVKFMQVGVVKFNDFNEAFGIDTMRLVS